MTRKQIETMRQHIADVCAAHDIWVRYDDNVREPYAIRKAYGATDEIMVRPIKSPITYAVALHEIGHLLGRNQMARSHGPRALGMAMGARKRA